MNVPHNEFICYVNTRALLVNELSPTLESTSSLSSGVASTLSRIVVLQTPKFRNIVQTLANCKKNYLSATSRHIIRLVTDSMGMYCWKMPIELFATRNPIELIVIGEP